MTKRLAEWRQMLWLTGQFWKAVREMHKKNGPLKIGNAIQITITETPK